MQSPRRRLFFPVEITDGAVLAAEMGEFRRHHALARRDHRRDGELHRIGIFGDVGIEPRRERQIAQFAPARVDDLVRARGVAGRRADHVALTDGKDFVADPVGSLTRDDEEHFLVGVMRMARERLLAGRNDVQLTAELARANDGADPPELGDELLAIAAVRARGRRRC